MRTLNKFFRPLAVFALALSLALGGYAAEAKPDPRPIPSATVEDAAPADAIFDRVLQSTYRIACYSQDLYNKDGALVVKGRPTGSGTGNAIGPRHIITAAHVANGIDGEQYKLDVFDKNGKYERSIALTLIKVGASAVDVALLESPEDLPHYLDFKLAGSDINQRVFNVGAKLGLSARFVSFGVVAAKDWLDSGGWNDSHGVKEYFHFTDMQIAPGCSGGGVYDLRGRMVGIATRGAGEYGVALYVPATIVKSFLDEARSPKPVPVPVPVPEPSAAGVWDAPDYE